MKNQYLFKSLQFLLKKCLFLENHDKLIYSLIDNSMENHFLYTGTNFYVTNEVKCPITTNDSLLSENFLITFLVNFLLHFFSKYLSHFLAFPLHNCGTRFKRNRRFIAVPSQIVALSKSQ